MIRPFPNLLPALALTLGSGALVAAPAARLAKPVLASYQALQPTRAAQAQSYLSGLRPQLGLGERDGFVARNAFTNDQGQAIVRLQQTFDGFRVWGGQAIAHVLTDGTVRALTQSVRVGIALPGGTQLSAGQAERIALARLAAKGPMQDTPEVEKVVFPTRFVGGLASRLDPSTGMPVLDRAQVVHASPEDPYVWAYEVRTRLRNAVDGSRAMAYVVDGNTGAILHCQDLVQHLEPATGYGNSYYQGTVQLSTTRMLDGTYTLMDSTRGNLPSPWLQFFSADPVSGWDPSIPGNQVWFSQNDAQGNYLFADYLFQGSLNIWGNGLPFTAWGDEGGMNGQTAGADAMNALTTTWDFYRNVFGRTGMDGAGTSVVATVLQTTNWYRDNAEWNIWGQAMVLGAGSYPQNPKGFQSMTDLDIIAHEMTHGVSSPSQTQYWINSSGYEEAGLNEATSDFFSQMVKAYSQRGNGSDSLIPPTGADWQIGRNVGHGTPIRWMDKPSRDQRSLDGWYDGICYMDGHFSAGPLNRAFHYLCSGAPSSPLDAAFSPYLPGGMAGIGNDAAARILYKAVTERLLGDGTGAITFRNVREACLAVAEELSGSGSAQLIAVENAFAAANIGDAHGQAPRIQVLFADWRDGDFIETSHSQRYANRQILPKGETVFPRVSVTHASNTAVTWSLGGPSLFNGADYWVSKGGVLNPDGSWTTPNVMGWHAITATSKADPNQFAEGRVFLIDMDTDMDLEQDALDMAGIAFSWYLTNSLNPAHSVFEAPWVDDADVAFFVDAMKATWPVK